MRSHRMAIGVIVGLLCIAGLLVVLWTRSGGRATAGEPKRSVPASAASGADQAQQVAAALRKLASDPSSLVASSAKAKVAGRAARAVPEGSRVTPRPASWQPDGVGGGVMTVSVAPPGAAAVDYAAVMVKENGSWKVLATMALPAATSPKPVTS